jgi:hypothetical protein
MPGPRLATPEDAKRDGVLDVWVISVPPSRAWVKPRPTSVETSPDSPTITDPGSTSAMSSAPPASLTWPRPKG